MFLSPTQRLEKGERNVAQAIEVQTDNAAIVRRVYFVVCTVSDCFIQSEDCSLDCTSNTVFSSLPDVLVACGGLDRDTWAYLTPMEGVILYDYKLGFQASSFKGAGRSVVFQFVHPLLETQH